MVGEWPDTGGTCFPIGGNNGTEVDTVQTHVVKCGALDPFKDSPSLLLSLRGYRKLSSHSPYYVLPIVTMRRKRERRIK